MTVKNQTAEKKSIGNSLLSRRIFKWLQILLVLAVSAALIYAEYVNYCLYRDTMINLQKDQMLAAVETAADSLENTLSDIADSVSLVASAGKDEREEMMRQLVDESSYISNMCVMDGEKNILFQLKEESFGESYFDAKLSGKQAAAGFAKNQDGSLKVLIGVPASSGKYVVGIVDADELYEFISNVRFGTQGYYVLKSAEGIILMHPTAEQIGIELVEGRTELYGDHDVDLSSLQDMLALQYAGETGTAEYYSYWWQDPDVPRVRKISAYTPLEFEDDFLVLSAVIDYSDLNEPIMEGFTKAAATWLLLMGFLGVLAIAGLRTIWENRRKQKEIDYLKDLNDVLEKTHQGETEIAHQQRLQIMGTVTGGLAHEFNNLLTPIMGYAEILSMSLPEGSEEQEEASEILETTEKAKDLVRQISSMSRKNIETTFEYVTVKDVLKRYSSMIRPMCPHNITVETVNEDKDNTGFAGSRTQIFQVLLNMTVNAFHAIGDKEDGKVTVTADVIDEAEAEQIGFKGPKGVMGKYVRFRVEDNGCGMDETVKSQIFTPFFTTKTEGKGTGLGLSLVEQIVSSHRGSVSVESEVGKGSCFTVLIPASAEVRESGEKESTALSILIVDDNMKIVESLCTSLEKIGVNTDWATSTEDALKKIKEERPDVLLVDESLMPSGSDKQGIDLLMAVGKTDQERKQILMTDFVSREVVEAVQNGIADAYLQKPVSVPEIIQKIQELLKS